MQKHGTVKGEQDMKQIENYAADKYSNEAYKEVEANIYMEV